jgi:hypothetical protein
MAIINWLITARLKRDFGALAALSAGCGEHLPGGLRNCCYYNVPTSLPDGTRDSASARWYSFGLEKLLVFSAEGERVTTIGALDRLVLKTHWMTSSLTISWSFGHPILKKRLFVSSSEKLEIT